MQDSVRIKNLGVIKRNGVRLGWTGAEFTESLAALADGRIDPAPVISDEIPLTGVADAFRRLDDPEDQIKILVRPSWS